MVGQKRQAGILLRYGYALRWPIQVAQARRASSELLARELKQQGATLFTRLSLQRSVPYSTASPQDCAPVTLLGKPAVRHPNQQSDP